MILSREGIGEVLRLERGEIGEITVQSTPPEPGTEFWARTKMSAKPVCRLRTVDNWPLDAGGFSVLVERISDLPRSKPRIKQELRLTRGQRNSLVAGGFPTIRGEGKCPVERGHVIQLSQKTAFLVVGVKTPKAGQWELKYEVVQDDEVLLLRRGGGYTSDEKQAVEDAGEAPPRAWTDPGHTLRASQRIAYEEAVRDRMSVGEQLDRLLVEAKRAHVEGVRDRANKIKREMELLEKDIASRRAGDSRSEAA